MSTIQSSPTQAKQKILGFLSNRGGVVRAGQYSVQQFVHLMAFKNRNGSNHHAISLVQDCLEELQAEGKIVLRTNDRGMPNYVALATADNPDSATGGELTDEERAACRNDYAETLYDTLSQLVIAQKEAADNLQLAEEYDKAAQAANTAMLEAQAKQQAAETELVEQAANNNPDGIRKLLTEQEAELAKLRTEKTEAWFVVEEKTSEIKRLSERNAYLESQNASQKDLTDKLQRKIKTAEAEHKTERRYHANLISDLKNQIRVLERSDGLTPVKATAVALGVSQSVLNESITDINESLHQIAKKTINAMLEITDEEIEAMIGKTMEKMARTIIGNCEKYLPTDKREAFLDSVGDTYPKINISEITNDQVVAVKIA
ncbi:MAG: hypothetical protein LBM12_02145 [Candidatus Nomurabacteria bacterium]|jgi:hypothetical protein|nr:hypothetical protein [Candidatus Nomurabacteria bacterium]